MQNKRSKLCFIVLEKTVLCLTHLDIMNFPILTNKTSPFPISVLLDGTFVQILIEYSARKHWWSYSGAVLGGLWSGSVLFAYIPD